MGRFTNLVVDGDIYCFLDRNVTKEPDPNCDHDWKQVKHSETYGAWECQKCHGYVEIGVWD